MAITTEFLRTNYVEITGILARYSLVSDAVFHLQAEGKPYLVVKNQDGAVVLRKIEEDLLKLFNRKGWVFGLEVISEKAAEKIKSRLGEPLPLESLQPDPAEIDTAKWKDKNILVDPPRATSYQIVNALSDRQYEHSEFVQVRDHIGNVNEIRTFIQSTVASTLRSSVFPHLLDLIYDFMPAPAFRFHNVFSSDVKESQSEIPIDHIETSRGDKSCPDESPYVRVYFKPHVNPIKMSVVMHKVRDIFNAHLLRKDFKSSLDFDRAGKSRVRKISYLKDYLELSVNEEERALIPVDQICRMLKDVNFAPQNWEAFEMELAKTFPLPSLPISVSEIEVKLDPRGLPATHRINDLKEPLRDVKIVPPALNRKLRRLLQQNDASKAQTQPTKLNITDEANKINDVVSLLAQKFQNRKVNKNFEIHFIPKFFNQNGIFDADDIKNLIEVIKYNAPHLDNILMPPNWVQLPKKLQNQLLAGLFPLLGKYPHLMLKLPDWPEDSLYLLNLFKIQKEVLHKVKFESSKFIGKARTDYAALCKEKGKSQVDENDKDNVSFFLISDQPPSPAVLERFNIFAPVSGMRMEPEKLSPASFTIVVPPNAKNSMFSAAPNKSPPAPKKSAQESGFITTASKALG